MKDLWIKTGCFITGWNYHILQSCTESSRKQLKKYLSAILILIILWAFIGYTFSQRYIKTELWGSLIAALIFVVIIVQVERQIILTVGKTKGLAFLRLVLAVIMAIIGSVIIDQIIFKDDIDKKMVELVDMQVNEQLPRRIQTIDQQLKTIQQDVDSLNAYNLVLYEEISKQPTLRTSSTNRTPMTIRRIDGSDSIAYATAVVGTNIPNPKINEAEINQNKLEILRKQQEQFVQKKMDMEVLLRQELSEKKGFLEELRAIVYILKESTVALIFYLILFLFLLFLELFVVISKSMDKSSDYDLVIEHQLKQKRKTLDELTKSKDG